MSRSWVTRMIDDQVDVKVTLVPKNVSFESQLSKMTNLGDFKWFPNENYQTELEKKCIFPRWFYQTWTSSRPCIVHFGSFLVNLAGHFCLLIIVPCHRPLLTSTNYEPLFLLAANPKMTQEHTRTSIELCLPLFILASFWSSYCPYQPSTHRWGAPWWNCPTNACRRWGTSHDQTQG